MKVRNLIVELVEMKMDDEVIFGDKDNNHHEIDKVNWWKSGDKVVIEEK